jgi:hypothetical protein
MKTFGEVQDAGFKMRGRCAKCGREKFLDLSKFDRGLVWAGKKFRCECGGVAEVKVIDPAVEGYKRQSEGW